MGFNFHIHTNKVKKAVEKTVTDIDVESLQKSLLQKNGLQTDFIRQLQTLSDEISNTISRELFNSQYKETPVIKKLKTLQTQSSKAKTIDELNTIKKNLESIIQPSSTTASKQLGINALLKKK